MNIIYSPEFNSTSYINLQQRQGQLLGLKVCGSTELLSELELRAGITELEQSEPERLVAFHESVKKNVTGTIFEESFKTDEVGVARQLMAWTDSLLMAGWTPDTTIESDKLKALAKIAKGVIGKHVAQRWQDLSAYLKEHPTSRNIWSSKRMMSLKFILKSSFLLSSSLHLINLPNKPRSIM